MNNSSIKIPNVELGSQQKSHHFNNQGTNYHIDDNCEEIMNIITGDNQKERAIASIDKLLNKRY